MADEAQPNSTDEEARRLKQLIQAVTDYAIYMLDANGTVTSWNTGAERLKGYSEAQILGQNFSLFFTPEDRAAGKPQKALETARSVGRYEEEGWRIRRDGRRFWALAVIDAIHDVDGTVLGFAKITRDLTDRHHALEALRQSEQRFRLLVESVVDYSLFMIDREGIVRNWNPGAQRTQGYTADEIVGRHFSVFYTDEDRKAGLPARALQTAVETGKYEVLAAHRDRDTVVVNALNEQLHRGLEPSRYGRPGRIPGSRNVSAASLIDPQTKGFVPLVEAEKKFEAQDVTRDKRVVAYCGGGISATIDLFQLYRLGYGNLTLYDGSMGEWAKDNSLPIETG